LLNHKIKQYEKAASNPYGGKQKKFPLTQIWVEDVLKDEHS